MKAYELTSWLEKKYPSDAAEDWDNVGLLAGDDTNEISHVFLALDLTEETLAEAIEDGADMIITHHPMIFSGIKKINNHSFTGRKILTLIQKGIVYYAMHTNYDVLGMADLSADYTKMHDTTVLFITEERDGEVQGFGRVGKLPREMTLREYAQLVKESLKLNDVKVYGNLDSMVKCAAVCTGSGKSMIKDVIKAGYEPITIFILAPGAFFVLAALSALQNKFKIGAAKRGIDPSNPDCGGSCAACGNTMCKGKRG